MYHIHGNLVLNGKWSEDLIGVLGMAFLSRDFQKLFGKDATTTPFTGSQAYVVDGRGCLALSDAFTCANYVFDRRRAKYARSCELFLARMREDELSFSFHLSQDDIHVGGLRDYSVRFCSDGEKLISGDARADTPRESCAALDGYAMNLLARIVFNDAFDTDFDLLDNNTQALVRTSLYLDVLEQGFFDDVARVLCRCSPEAFDSELSSFLWRFAHEDGNRDAIRDALSELHIGKKAAS